MIDRIITPSASVNGQPIVKGTHFPVSAIIESIVVSQSLEEVLEAFPGLTRDDISACLEFGLSQ
tara:strand:+ start:3438 stop:3629 length:192 start_codon:yes stop_codon:yes gene_type:complete